MNETLSAIEKVKRRKTMLPSKQRTTSRSPRTSYYPLIASAIVLLAFGLRVWDLGKASLWVDEVVTSNWNNIPLREFWRHIFADGVHPPLYFLWTRLFPTFSEAVLRLSAVWPGVIGVALLIGMTDRLYHNRSMALWAGALLAINPYHIWLSKTARPYSAVFVFSLVSSYFFLTLYQGRRTRVNWTCYVISTAALYMTHYFGALLFLAQYVFFVFLLSGERAFLRRWIVAQAVASLPLLVWLVTLSRQEFGFGIAWISTPSIRDIPLTFWSMTNGYAHIPLGYQFAGLVAASIGIVSGVIYAWRKRRDNSVNFYWLLLITLPWFVITLVSFLRPVYVDRYFIIFLTGLLLLILVGWMRLPRPVWRTVGIALLIVSNGATVITMHSTGSFEREGWRSAASYVASQLQPNDGLLIEAHFVQNAFRYYFDRLVDEQIDSFRPGEEDRAAAAQLDRLWVIYRNPTVNVHQQGPRSEFDPFDPDLSIMGKWLASRQEQVISSQDFRGVTVLAVQLATDP